MARRKGSDSGVQMNPLAWMTTFSDLVTLLLTFFVLLISMSSMDVRALQQAFGLFFTGGSGPLGFVEKGKLEEVGRLIEKTVQVPAQLLLDQKEIKETIFKFEEIDYQKLLELVEQDISVVKDERGLIIQIADYILFDEGRAELRPEYLPILSRLADILRATYFPVSVEGHTDDFLPEGRSAAWAWGLSLERAITVMKYLTAVEGLMPERFRVGGFGPSKPLVPNTNPVNRAKNRRIEIIIYREILG